MTAEAAWAAREALVIRELLQRAQPREACLRALLAQTRAGEVEAPLPDARSADTGEEDAVGDLQELLLTCGLPTLAKPRLAPLARRRGRS